MKPATVVTNIHRPTAGTKDHSNRERLIRISTDSRHMPASSGNPSGVDRKNGCLFVPILILFHSSPYHQLLVFNCENNLKAKIIVTVNLIKVTVLDTC